MSESLGQRLRAAREAKGVSLDEVERITRIRAKFIDAFERDDFSGLPSEAQARGFLRNYAEYLGLDVAELLSSADSARRRKIKLGPTQPRRVAPAPATPPNGSKAAPLPPRPAPIENMGRAPQILSRRPRWLSPDLLFAIAVSLVIVLLLVWAIGQLTPGLTAAPTPTLALILPGETLAPTAISQATPTPEATPTLALPTPLPEYVGVNLSLRAEQRIWVSVKVDGVEQFVGQIAAGEIKDFVGQSVVEITTGNGLGTRIIWNGRDQGTLGRLGEAVIRLWTVDGMLAPTPTVTPTATP